MWRLFGQWGIGAIGGGGGRGLAPGTARKRTRPDAGDPASSRPAAVSLCVGDSGAASSTRPSSGCRRKAPEAGLPTDPVLTLFRSRSSCSSRSFSALLASISSCCGVFSSSNTFHRSMMPEPEPAKHTRGSRYVVFASTARGSAAGHVACGTIGMNPGQKGGRHGPECYHMAGGGRGGRCTRTPSGPAFRMYKGLGPFSSCTLACHYRFLHCPALDPLPSFGLLHTVTYCD